MQHAPYQGSPVGLAAALVLWGIFSGTTVTEVAESTLTSLELAGQSLCSMPYFSPMAPATQEVPLGV